MKKKTKLQNNPLLPVFRKQPPHAIAKENVPMGAHIGSHTHIRKQTADAEAQIS